MKIELFHAPGCSRCAAARESLKAAAETAVTGLEWREVNVLDEMDYAVERGVLSLPAVVIDGELVFSTLPTPRQLRAALIGRNLRGH
ncbi:MAG: thioredoxin family protein [Reyranella sp.]|uniref:Glutaredoxin n=1 Tax=Enhydrobacter aerosaccus TaxID=225324 RepID=A0A1T4SKW3_9HYPH|nr:thioredoxin family protein [Enhydrobacter aerosaccus]KAF0102119.1 MAG: thioredoxin/glutaredoxin [Rhodospirillaceae bacterium]TBR22552.1 MAG: thioredoxin family protein [Reyranella sp.]SKA28815.1 Glutaredoxin [Enhydrobacter aerosaccus]